MNDANGYEPNALDFLAARDTSSIGVDIIERWARSLKPGAKIIEIGCGGGLPVTGILVSAGLELCAIDASPTLLETFKARFPQVPVKCEPAESSDFFGLRYDAAIAIGLLFLLNEPAQLALITRLSQHLEPGGRFLFTAPIPEGQWKDVLTGQKSCSLGYARYEEALRSAGLEIIGSYKDEGENHYYEAEKRALASPGP